MASYYEDERRRYRPARETRRDDYDDDSTVYDRPRGNTRSSALVKRRDSYDDVDDEITRDFPPPDGRGGYIRETTIRKSGTRPARTRSYDDDKYYDDRYDNRSYASGRRNSKAYDDRRDRRSRRYSSDNSSRSRSRTPPKRDRRKSKPEEALEALGLGGIAAALLGKKERSRSRDRNKSRGRDRAYSEDRYSRRRSKSRGTGQEQLVQALKAAVLAGAGEAFLARKEPGGWGGEKGKRVLTAAFSAGGVDGLISHNKDPEDHKTRNAIGSAIAGLATSRIVNGPQRSASRGRGASPNSTRGRSQSRGGLGDVAAGGVIAAAAKKAYDNFRGAQSQTRGRQRSRSSSFSSASRSRSRTNRRRSVSRGVAKGLAAVGLTGVASKVDPGRRSRRNSDDYEDRYGGRGYGDYRDDDVGQPRSGPINGHARSVSQPRSDWHVAQRTGTPSNYALDYGPRHTGDPETDSDSDLGSSSDEAKEHKKGRQKQLLTTGLATIATIHAGHSVYQTYEKRNARIKAVKKGQISPEEAKKNRNRDRLQDAASIGIAALGIKGAYSEWKEMKEAREEVHEKRETLERHRSKRAARREKYRDLQESGYLDSGHANSMPNLHSPQPMAAPPMGGGYFSPYDSPRYDGQGPYGGVPPPNQGAPIYYDDNPYHTTGVPPPPTVNQVPNGTNIPPPPVGHPQPQMYYPQQQQQQPPPPSHPTDFPRAQ